MTPPLLRVAGLSRSFGSRRVLAGIDLTVGTGETVAIIGPNGAGKTTLLRCVAGLMRPDAGTVELQGQAVTARVPESRSGIGLLSHRSMLYDDLSLGENLEFAARLHGLADPAAAARGALADAGLAERAGDSPRTLSRGLLQRAALARALLHSPRLLLLDEPFTGLDAAAAGRLHQLLRDRRPQGLATVVVTHQVAEVWELCTRVLVLARGGWALEGDPGSALEPFLRRYAEVIPA